MLNVCPFCQGQMFNKKAKLFVVQDCHLLLVSHTWKVSF